METKEESWADIYPFNPNSAKSNIANFSKITNWATVKNKQYSTGQQLSIERSHFRVLSI